MQLYKKICAGKVQYPPFFSADLVDLLSKMLTNEKKRMTLAQIKTHKWFKVGLKENMERILAGSANLNSMNDNDNENVSVSEKDLIRAIIPENEKKFMDTDADAFEKIISPKHEPRIFNAFDVSAFFMMSSISDIITSDDFPVQVRTTSKFAVQCPREIFRKRLMNLLKEKNYNPVVKRDTIKCFTYGLGNDSESVITFKIDQLFTVSDLILVFIYRGKGDLLVFNGIFIDIRKSLSDIGLLAFLFMFKSQKNAQFFIF